MDFADEQLVTNVRNGDSSAYTTLFEKYQGGIYNFAYSIVRSTEDAKDIAQEAFIKVFEVLPRLEEKAKFSSYLYRTARNLAMDTLKAQNRYGTAESLELEKDTHIESDPQRSLLLQEQQTDVKKAAANLANDYRMILSLRELQDLSYDEISSVMEIPKNSVGVLLLRARLKFKQEFRMSQVDVEKLSKECKKMLPLLSAYIDNELSEEERGKVTQHLDDCPLCRLALEEMTEASKSYRGFIPILPPPDLKANVFAHIKNQISGEFQAPETTSSAAPADTGSEVNQQMSAQDMPTLKMKPLGETTDGSGEITTSAKDISVKSTKGKGAKSTGLSTAKKVLIVAAAIIIIGGTAATGLAGIYSLQSKLQSDIGNLTPYSNDLPSELLEKAPEVENGITVEEPESDLEESEETEETGGKPSSSEREESEEVNPETPDEEEPPQQGPGDETTPTPEPSPNEDPDQTPDPDQGKYDTPDYRVVPLFPRLVPLKPIDPIDPIE